MSNNFSYDSLSKKSKAELLELALDYNVPGYKKLNKSELVEVLTSIGDANGRIPKAEKKGLWSKYHNHVYGLTSVVGLLLAVFAFFPKGHDSTASKAVDIQNHNPLSENSIAVLPFANMSANKENQYFTDGMHDGLLTHLSKISSLVVISRTSVNRYRETKKSIPLIGKELGVANILEGSVQRAGDKLRINVQLIQAETDKHLWSEIYDRQISTENIFDIQTEISTAIARELRATITTGQQKLLHQRPTENLLAYEALLRSRQLIEVRSVPSLQEARSLLEMAVKEDPNFAQAYIYLGITHNLLDYYSIIQNNEIEPNHTHLELANSYLKKGISLNPSLAEAHALKGLLHVDNFEYEEAVKSYEKAIEINPNYESTYHWYGNYMRDLGGSMDKSLLLFRKGLELNPVSPVINHNIGWVYSYLNNDKAKVYFEKAIELSPSYSYPYLGCSQYYHTNEKLDSAAIVSHRGIETNGLTGIDLYTYLEALNILSLDNMIYQVLGSTEEANSENQKLIYEYRIAIALKNKLISEDDQNLISEDDKPNLMKWYYQDQKWLEYIDLYEEVYPEIVNQSYNFNVRRPDHGDWDFTELSKYIYALFMSGDNEKAQKLWDHYYPMIALDDENIDLTFFESNERLWFKIRYAAAKKDRNAILELFKDFRKSRMFFQIPMYINDPVLDLIRENPEYVKVIADWEAKVSLQQESFLNYLAEKKPEY